jgi:23S rRNA (guanosine2251-2'-O)-methyltransferase
MNGIQVCAAEGNAEKSIRDIDWQLPSALVMGSEDKGVSQSTLNTADHLVNIPQFGTTESLNVSVACGIILYEASMQRLSGEAVG